MKSILPVVAFFALVAILILSLVPGEYRPHTMILPGAMEHVSAYIVATFLLCLAYHNRLSPLRVILLLTAYGALLELGQLFVPGRHGNPSDVVADFAGAAIGAVVASAVVHPAQGVVAAER
jgi:VanZ family protein